MRANAVPYGIAEVDAMQAVRHWVVRHAGLVERAYGALYAVLRAMGPLARAIGPTHLRKPVTGVERAVKGFLFDCRMCGSCALSANGMACPMNCPKQLRNGPCGGIRHDGTCEVDPALRCVHLEAWRGAARMRAGQLALAPTPPPRHERAGNSTWLPLMVGDEPDAAAESDVPVRPSGSRLEALFASGTFVVTAEFSPPDSADPADVFIRLDPFRGNVDALNVTDGSGANCHMSSLGVAVLLAQAGCEPVMQVTCRDRNRIAIQGDLLGAAAIGIRNVLCLTGDHVGKGDHPGARHVGDLDSHTLLATARQMRDAGRFLSGRKLSAAPRLLLGAAANPSALPLDVEIGRLRRKIAAGAQFVQTQYCFDLERLDEYMRRVRAEGLHQRAALVIGVGPIASAKTARWLQENIPGVHIPAAMVARLEQARDPREEGRRICIELIRGIRAIPGIAGIHVMAYRMEHLLPSIIADSDVLAGRTPLFSATSPIPDHRGQP
ncbi:MAG: methylenetetrahydrofolate reductase C-terminal domain-containing protein [Burkholderiales bacterium]|nr:methylenetetrahydrofolate reductase C-terminal domain-containing protein [Burkholderiales bacterium]